MSDPVHRLLSPYLSDKMVDWELIGAIGGHDVLRDKHILELGPSYGTDLYHWAPYAKSYTMIDSDPGIIGHIQPLMALLRHRGMDVVLYPHNLRQGIPFADGVFDLVIDFGTVDNVLAGVEPLRESMRVLKPGGFLITTYANFDYFKEEKSSCGDEERFHPNGLAQFFASDLCGGEVVFRGREDQARAQMAVRKR